MGSEGSKAPRAPEVPAPCGGNVGIVQPKMAAGAAQAPRQPVPPAPCGGNTGAPGAVQPKMGSAGPGVVQLAKKACLRCKHRHTVKCTTLIPDGNGGTKQCGCVSHSQKHDSGAKFDSKGGKRARMIARNTRQTTN